MRHLFKREPGAENFSKTTKTGSFFRATRRTAFRARCSKDTGSKFHFLRFFFRTRRHLKRDQKDPFRQSSFFVHDRNGLFYFPSLLLPVNCSILKNVIYRSWRVIQFAFDTVGSIFSQLFYLRSINLILTDFKRIKSMRKLNYRQTHVSICSDMQQNTETKVCFSETRPASMNFLFPNTTNVRKYYFVFRIPRYEFCSFLGSRIGKIITKKLEI